MTKYECMCFYVQFDAFLLFPNPEHIYFNDICGMYFSVHHIALAFHRFHTPEDPHKGDPP